MHRLADFPLDDPAYVASRRASLTAAPDDTRLQIDLGLALALASSVTDRPLDAGLVACGEIGLAGELRQSAQIERRLHEAARVGFTTAVIPAGAPATPDGIVGIRAETLAEALHLTHMLGPTADELRPQLLSESEFRAASDW